MKIVNHEERYEQILQLIDGERTTLDLAKMLAPVWGVEESSCRSLLSSYLSKLRAEGVIEKARTWMNSSIYKRTGRVLRSVTETPRVAAPLPPPVLASPAGKWTMQELLLWLLHVREVNDLPPYKLKDAITDEAVGKAIETVRHAIALNTNLNGRTSDETTL